ncbi:hypothetical protein C2R22_10505 [Salinigranum rubrum]|uniref:Uncharacterized protein n=1 Tax=Salinigranum rubrum TaxID=755307 RepID=A0A2I8VJB2_9EURY|nr:hypothetical protein [Salinigranum rubrum]AUV82027.1 hypothetical protein C2R22_10505 [Salinigranum rubrum]
MDRRTEGGRPHGRTPRSPSRSGVVAIAFWVAIVAPLLVLALLFGGLEAGETAAFVTLVVVNLVALGVGHRYRHPEPSRPDERR